MIAVFLLAAVVATVSTEYRAKVVRVIDGDTVAVTVEIWPGITAESSIRLRGADTPEIWGKCAQEKAKAREAKAAVEKLLPKNSTVTLRNLKPDKYAQRHDADIILADGQSLAFILINNGLARKYQGGKRLGWCAG